MLTNTTPIRSHSFWSICGLLLLSLHCTSQEGVVKSNNLWVSLDFCGADRFTGNPVLCDYSEIDSIAEIAKSDSLRLFIKVRASAFLDTIAALEHSETKAAILQHRLLEQKVPAHLIHLEVLGNSRQANYIVLNDTIVNQLVLSKSVVINRDFIRNLHDSIKFDIDNFFRSVEVTLQH